MSDADVFEEFQQALFGLVRRLLPSDGTRFFIYVPWVQLKQEAASDSHIDGFLAGIAQQKSTSATGPFRCSGHPDSIQRG